MSSIRIFPNAGIETPKTVPLSIIDSTVLRYGPTTAIWFFEAPRPNLSFAVLSKQLQHSLEYTLSNFPQLCGLLHYTNHDPEGDHTHRYRRVAITYGKATDPGVELVTATSESTPLDELVPSATARRAGSGVWDGTHIPLPSLIPSRTHLSLGNLESQSQTLPCVIIQLTSFKCGGMALAVRCSHAVMDSISLLYFVNRWAETNRAIQCGTALPIYSPVFDPGMLDRAAAGDIDAAVADPGFVEKALAMPMHRYDLWNQATEAGDAHIIPKDFDPSSIILGTPPPFQELNPEAKISFCVLHFSHREIENIWQAANAAEAPVSHHDALCAHIWILINRARGLETDDGEVHLDFTIGLRTRTSPPLPPTFLGSPTLIGDISMKSREASSLTFLPVVAANIRSTIQQFDSESVGAVLHHRAFDESPQRYLHSFTGLRHVIQTSWMGSGAYDVDFGGGVLRWVMGAMAMIDGFVQTLEAASIGGGGEGEPGIDVAVRIEEGVMRRLVVDPLLRRYRQ